MTQDYYKRGYFPELNGLRGIAIISVMFFHAEVPYFGGTFIGVDIFFVLSGFLITRILVQEFDRFESINLKNFYIRRILRLGPALIALLFVFCLISFVFLSQETARKNYVDSIISLAYLTNWVRAFLIYPPGLLSHTWSLSMEEQFYIGWPIVLSILLRISKRRSHIAIVAIIIAALSWCLRIYLTISGSTHDRIFFGLDTRADALMIGCALGVILSSRLITERAIKMLSKILIFIAPLSLEFLIIFFFYANWRDPKMYLWGFIIVDLLTVILILNIFVNSHSIIGKIFANKWLMWIGTISYGLYLWHFPIYLAIQSLGYDYKIVISIGSLLSFFIATISYRFLESPILKQKERFTL